MAYEVGKIFVSITADDSELKRRLEAAHRYVKNFADRLGSIGTTLTQTLSLSMSGVAFAAYKMVEGVDAGFAELVKATDASGAELEKLRKIYERVLRSVEYTPEQVGLAIGALRARLKVTGKDLEKFSIQLLKFSEITNTDVGTAVRIVTRLMGDWSIKSSELPRVLDKLALAAKFSGMNIAELGEKMVFYGVQLRTMGFSFDETIALLAKWEKEGVSYEKILARIGSALGGFAKKAKDPQKEIWKLIAAIKKAKTDQEAYALATKALGRQAGLDFAKAVREGRFEIENYVRALNNAKGVVSETEKRSSTLSDVIAELKNRIAVDLYPAAKMFIEEIIKLLPYVDRFIKFLTKLTEGFNKLDPSIKNLIISLAGFAVAVGPALVAVSYVIKVFAGLVGVLLKIKAIAAAVAGGFSAAWLAAAALIGGAVILLTRRFVEFYKKTGSILKSVELTVKSFVNRIINIINRFVVLWNKTIGRLTGKKLHVVGYLSMGEKKKRRPIGGPTPFASGGIVKKATLALIGEKEPEAVIPLSKLDKLVKPQSVSVSVLIKPSSGAEKFVDFTVRKSIARWR